MTAAEVTGAALLLAGILTLFGSALSVRRAGLWGGLGVTLAVLGLFLLRGTGYA